jgi:hypothetical protein
LRAWKKCGIAHGASAAMRARQAGACRDEEKAQKTGDAESR